MPRLITNGQFVLVTNVVLLTNNLVSVVTDPSDSLGRRCRRQQPVWRWPTARSRARFPPFPAGIYNVTFWYRGPGIAGWWRGEGNATDSSDPENNDNNGTLIGRFNFPAGEVGQAFQFEDPGQHLSVCRHEHLCAGSGVAFVERGRGRRIHG